jgi:hypothetical protein
MTATTTIFNGTLAQQGATIFNPGTTTNTVVVGGDVVSATGGAAPSIWASIETQDTFAAVGHLIVEGPMAAQEGSDSWATSDGIDVLEVENVYPSGTGNTTGYTGGSIVSTNGPDRIIVLIHTAVSVSGQVEAITSITDSSPGGPLNWQPAGGEFTGPSNPNDDNCVTEIWYAFAHNKLTNISITYDVVGTTSNSLVTLFTVKGLNGNYNNPFNSQNFSDFSGSFGGFLTAGDATVTSDNPAAPQPIATGLGDGSRAPQLIVEIEFSVVGAGKVGPPNSPAGFTEITRVEQTGSQRDTATSVNVAILNNGIRDAAHNSGTPIYVTHPTAAPVYQLVWGTMYQGAVTPGQMEAHDGTDTAFFRGYAGAFGVVGDLTTTGALDTFAAVGYQPNVGVWLSREAADTFSAFIRQPITGQFVVTEGTDRFNAAGLGRGENGVFITTESVDIFAATGYTPDSGPWVSTENADQFRAFAPGTQLLTKKRRVFFVT